MIPAHDLWDDALCAQVGIELFFPGKGESATPAKRVCRACPVQERCLEWALSVPVWMDQDGVYGGLSPRQRRTLRAQRREAA